MQVNSLHAVMLRDSSVAILSGWVYKVHTGEVRCKCSRGVVGSEYDSHTSVLSSYPGSVTSSLFSFSFFAIELFMRSIYRPVACNVLVTEPLGGVLLGYTRGSIRTCWLGVRGSEL